MKSLKKVMLLITFALGGFLFLLLPNIGAAKEITLNGTQASDAVITDSSGQDVTGDSNLNMWKDYNIHYNWSVPAGTTIKNGDTATFVIPDNVKVDVKISFPVRDTQGHVVGTFTIPKGSHTGTLTFNDHYEQYPTENIHGTIDFSVTGTTENEGDSSQNPVTKSGWFDDDTQIPTWNISYNHKSEHLTNVVITDTLHGEQAFYGDIVVQYGHYEGDQFIVEREEVNPSYVTIDGKNLTANIGDISQAVQIRYQTKPTNYQEGDKFYLENTAHASSDQLGESSDMASLDGWGNGSADGTAGHPSTSTSTSITESTTPSITTTSSESSVETTPSTTSSESSSDTTTSTTTSSESSVETTTPGSTSSESSSDITSSDSTTPGEVIIPETSSTSSSAITTVYEDKHLTEAINGKEKKLLPQTSNKKQESLSLVGLSLVAIVSISVLYIKKKAH